MTNSISPATAVSLEFYDSRFDEQLKNYYLTDEHLKFTGLPIDNLEICKLEEERHAIVIVSNNEVAGFFVLHGWEGVQQYSDNVDAILLRAYSIDSNFQGKGIAKHSLKLLPDFVRVHFPEKNEIILGVNHKNIAAQHVYLKSGFVDKGVRVMGKKGELFVMHMDLI
ncbi:GNAT family N-acetyltransferase [Bacillus sp. AFS017336]|uniref:GNAT family N-acetyltransferase n=1 Tax=Bacillus sp. AFS017336 TaxID=2033489 RepID=UPI000BF174A0|nr:GNAT family N-acetyltransferase [Bacillus sp. AFS017336]PEL09920.1 GNAT family N-acetyltransferase [Bacillus sp. AFS017336]